MTPNTIARARADIFDGPVQRRQVVAQAWLKRARADLARLEEVRAASAAEYRERREAWTGRPCGPHEILAVDLELQSQARRLRLCAIAGAALEVIFAALVAASSLSFAAYLSALVGGVAAFLLLAVVEGVHLPAYRPDHPATSRSVIERWLRWSFAVFAAGIVPLIISRTVPEAAPLANLSVALVTVGLTLVSAFLFILAFVLAWSNRYAENDLGLRVEIEETRRFIEELESLLRQKEVRILTFDR